MWYVWWRININGKTSAWHDRPRKYKTENAARRSEQWRNAQAIAYNCNLEYVALPEGVHPNSLGEDHESTRT
jgi:hypothetical protein